MDIYVLVVLTICCLLYSLMLKEAEGIRLTFLNLVLLFSTILAACFQLLRILA